MFCGRGSEEEKNTEELKGIILQDFQECFEK
jgi:hypothetical protein